MAWIHTHTIRLEDQETCEEVNVAYLVGEECDDDHISIDHEGGMSGMCLATAADVASAITELIEECGEGGDWHEAAEADRAKLVADRKRADAAARKRSTPTKRKAGET